MFTAYFDVSGDPRSEAITMAGYVSDARKWAKFEAEWNKILEREKVSSFHMTDFASKQEEYKGWDQRRRGDFIGDLLECSWKYTNKAFSATLALADYYDADRRYCLHEALGQPYLVCGRSCVGHVKKWARRHGVKQAAFVFESGDEDWEDFERVCAEQEKIVPTRSSKKDFVPFQAADLIAWKSRYPIRRVLSADLEETVEERERLLGMVGELKNRPYAGGVLDADSLTNICVKGSIPLREHREPGTFYATRSENDPSFVDATYHRHPHPSSSTSIVIAQPALAPDTSPLSFQSVFALLFLDQVPTPVPH